MAYITRISHFVFHKRGDQLVVTSERTGSFEEEYNWPEDLSMNDENLAPELHERYYTDLQKVYEG